MNQTWKQWEGRVVDGQFPLQAYLGGSDRSAVFLTRCTEGPQQKAAIKLIPTPAGHADNQLFRWRLAAKLLDPRLLRIFHVGQTKLEDTDLLYIVMEQAEEDLSQILPQRPLSPEEARQMLGPVLDALGYVHSKGFVHGSVKPSNIMAVGNQVKLASDSLHTPQEAPAQEPGSVYAAPEAVNRTSTPASDIWSLGVTLSQALTQQLPKADPAQPGAMKLPEGMPEPFAEVARRCLKDEPQQRWSVARIVAHLNGAPASASTEVEPTQEATAESSPRWLYFIALGVVALIALIWFVSSKIRSPKPSAPAQSAASQAVEPRPQAAVEGKPSPATPAAQPPAETNPASSPPTSTPAAPQTSNQEGPAKPGVVHTVMPAVSPGARRTISGKVKVRVRVEVDPSGNVTSASLDSAGPSKYFARVALEAARGWKFTPAQSNGQYVPSEWILRFAFSRSDTEVGSKQIRPQ